MFNLTDIVTYWLLASLIILELIIILERLDSNPVEDWKGYEWEDNLIMPLLLPVGILAIASKIIKLLIPNLIKLARIKL